MNETDHPKKLTLSATDKKVAGVCGGLAAYFNVDVSLVRILFVVLTLAGGPGLLLYIALWLVLPGEDETEPIVKIKRS